MRIFTSTVCALLAGAVLILAGCAGGVSRPDGKVEREIPVPVSAAQRDDFEQALALMRKEKYAEAIPVLEAILKENPRLPGAYINLAIANMKLAEQQPDNKDEYFGKAEAALNKAIEENPREAVARFEMGLLYRKTGRLEKARAAYEKALDIDSTYAMAHYNLGVLCDIYLQQFECAIKHFEVYQRLVPEDSEQVRLWLADLRRRAGVPQPPADDQGEEQS